MMGYKTAAISGAGLSESNLGWADVGIMGYAENLRASSALAAISSIPLSADGDTGYGNALNVYFTVQGFERAGLACLMIEDQVWPKRCGHMEGKRVISAEEGVEKIRAAAEARRDPDFVIKARTDATAIHGVGEAIRRLNLYAEAGADLLFADALLTAEDIATVARNVVKPLTVNMGFGIRQRPTTPLLSTQAIGGHGREGGVLPAHAHRRRDPGHEERARRARAVHRGRPRDRSPRSPGVVRRAQRPDGDTRDPGARTLVRRAGRRLSERPGAPCRTRSQLCASSTTSR